MIEVFKSPKAMGNVLKSYNALLRMWDVEYRERDVQTAFGTTHCIIAGNAEKPPLVLFHGVGDNSAVMWLPNIKELSKHFYCIAIDTLGGPGKSTPNEKYNKKNFNQQLWINEIAAHFDLKFFNIAGVSNGASIVFNYAINESNKINKAICLEGGIVTNPLKSIITTLGMMFPEVLIPTRSNMIKILQKLCSPDSDFVERYPEIADHLILLMKSHNQRAMFAHTVEKYNRDKGIAVNDKLYFLIGGHMLKKRKEVIDVLNEGAYKYKIIQNAGHAINHEQPEIINNEIINFICGRGLTAQ